MSRLHEYNERLHDILSSERGDCFCRRVVSMSIVILSPGATSTQFNVRWLQMAVPGHHKCCGRKWRRRGGWGRKGISLSNIARKGIGGDYLLEYL